MLAYQYASMASSEFSDSPTKWTVAERLAGDISEVEQLTPLDGARLISSMIATLFGYDEFILREFSPEALLATSGVGSAGR